VHLLANGCSRTRAFRLADDALHRFADRSAPLHDIGKVGIPDTSC
jgi:response regulator RpfG family c-di-GMP phosphodiesterase